MADCIMCRIAAGEVESKIVYSDDVVMAVLDINPASRGHILLFPKSHYSVLPMVPYDESSHLARAASALLSVLEQNFHNRRNTIFIANGGPAGQSSPHFSLHLMPSDTLPSFDMFASAPPDLNSYETMKKGMQAKIGQYYKQSGKQPVVKQSKHLFETETHSVKVPERSCGKGHVKVESKDIDEELFLSSSVSAAAFESLNAHGSNIIISKSDKAVAEILPRWSGDGVDLTWKGVQSADYEMEGICRSLSMSAMGISIKSHRVPDIVLKRFSMEKFKDIPNQKTWISEKHVH